MKFILKINLFVTLTDGFLLRALASLYEVTVTNGLEAVIGTVIMIAVLAFVFAVTKQHPFHHKLQLSTESIKYPYQQKKYWKVFPRNIKTDYMVMFPNKYKLIKLGEAEEISYMKNSRDDQTRSM